jgi:hypothetical protein
MVAMLAELGVSDNAQDHVYGNVLQETSSSKDCKVV